jgi:signal transduction histidine kinase
VLNRWNDAVQTRAAVTLESRLRDAAGAYRAFVIKAAPIIHGDAVKWLGACADIEDQKLLAEQKEMQARQKSYFLNALSHDLRAPLHNVLLNAQLLKMSAAARPPLAPENAATATATDLESIDMIVENAIAAGDLLAKLLDFARVGAADHNASEPVALAPLLQQVVRRFQPAAEQKGLFIRLAEDASWEGSAIEAQTDRHKLDRIVSNLVDNAVKYTQRGGVTLELLATYSGRDEHGVVLRVQDTGMGIPSDNVPYLFDEFYQVNDYERDRTKGFGMGLAICRSLARHIGGEVRLAHTGPEGSCFEVLLPPAATGGIRLDRGGRSLGTAGDRGDPHPPGLCGV